jgi:hypothetical protein
MAESIEKLVHSLLWKTAGDEAVAEFKRIEPELNKAAAEGPTAFRRVLEAMNLLPGEYPGGIPNNPSPLKSMLVSGLAGGAMGYGAGWLGEKVLPDNWKRNRLRWTLAMMGTGAGAAPGAAWGTMNLAAGLPFDDNSFGSDSSRQSAEVDYEKLSAELYKYSSAEPQSLNSRSSEVIKHAFIPPPNFGMSGLSVPSINVDAFNRVLWTDPRVGGQLSPLTRGAATGLMTAAANLPGKLQTKFVTPFDVGRIAAGMGSGYLSGAIVGKGLGLLMGMPQDTQEKLKNTGMFAGIVANLVPMAFGG